MHSLYIGSTDSYSGKNCIIAALGLILIERGFKVGYMKPVGAAFSASAEHGELDADARFVQTLLGLHQLDELVTPAAITPAFKKEFIEHGCRDFLEPIVEAHETLRANNDFMLIAGSGSFLHSGAYCNLNGSVIANALDAKVVLIDRFHGEFRYDYLIHAQTELAGRLLGVILNDLPPENEHDTADWTMPVLTASKVNVLGSLPRDPVLGAVRVGDLAERLGAHIIAGQKNADRMIESFMVGAMKVENFITHFQKRPDTGIIVGGDQSDIQVVALEGGAPCLILTGNLPPMDMVLTLAKKQHIPVILARDNSYKVAKKVDAIKQTQKLRDPGKVKRITDLVRERVDVDALVAALQGDGDSG
ncbi:phosphotransacetylase family protein [Desulfovibrio inopinatus]|uniref:phosphotransacetylase family protein n=1 Tax=Desulfovibrio inopinatus TaxID=102109 RepID=UPI00048067B7|nr:phosphotransacetylase family protein [Desulfovibrio inopinatus]